MEALTANEHKMTKEQFEKYTHWLRENERSKATVEKYNRDLRVFYESIPDDKSVNKALVLDYKERLLAQYTASSVNSMLAAINGFLKFMGWHSCVVRAVRTQRDMFRSGERELTKKDYERLLATATQKGNQRLNLIMQTICATGIRVSELQFVTVEAVNLGKSVIRCKGKVRTVLMPRNLCKLLRQYAKNCGIATGPVFVTKGGKPINRSNIWSDMKKLCEDAGVAPSKVFPHNLRHLFARTFYGLEQDIARLADILGHSSVETTRIYTITTGEENQKKIEALGLVS